MSASKFIAALKNNNVEPITEARSKPKQATDAKEAQQKNKAAQSREGAKHIGGYFSQEVSKQLKILSASEDTTTQDLLAEALDLLFQSRRLPMIAQSKKA
jgi:hypothetical protein